MDPAKKRKRNYIDMKLKQFENRTINYHDKKLTDQQKIDLIEELEEMNEYTLSDEKNYKITLHSEFTVTNNNKTTNFVSTQKKYAKYKLDFDEKQNHNNDLSKLLNVGKLNQIKIANKSLSFKERLRLKKIEDNKKKQQQKYNGSVWVQNKNNKIKETITKHRAANITINSEFKMSKKGMIFDNKSITIKYDKFLNEYIVNALKIKQKVIKYNNLKTDIAIITFTFHCDAFINADRVYQAIDMLKIRKNDLFNFINLFSKDIGSWEFTKPTLKFKVLNDNKIVSKYLVEAHNLTLDDKIVCGTINNNKLNVIINKNNMKYGLTKFDLYHNNIREFIRNKVNKRILAESLNKKNKLQIFTAIYETFHLNESLGNPLTMNLNLNWFVNYKGFIVENENDYILECKNFVIDEDFEAKMSAYIVFIKFNAQNQLYNVESNDVFFPLDKNKKLINNLYNLMEVKIEHIQENNYFSYTSSLSTVNSVSFKLLFKNPLNICPVLNYESNVIKLYPLTANIINDPTVCYQNKKVIISQQTTELNYEIMRNTEFNNCIACGSFNCVRETCPVSLRDLENLRTKYKDHIVTNNAYNLDENNIDEKVKKMYVITCFHCNKLFIKETGHNCNHKNIHYYTGLNYRNHSLMDPHNAGIFEIFNNAAIYKVCGLNYGNLLNNIYDNINLRDSKIFNKKLGIISFNDMIFHEIIASEIVDDDEKEKIIKNDYKYYDQKGILIGSNFIYFDRNEAKKFVQLKFNSNFKRGLDVFENNKLRIEEINNNNNGNKMIKEISMKTGANE